MIETLIKSITLQQFLALPEMKPANEYINGQIIAKPMPKARHSRLQSKIIQAINTVAEVKNIAYAFPELRCTFGTRSIVPDISILKWNSIKVDHNGEPLDDILMPPDWTIEILSPNQSSNKVTGNILHCLQYGCQLGWLIDPDDLSILTFQPEQQPKICYGKDQLKVLAEIDLQLTVEEIFSWLKIK